jgi:hypothetical protein
MQYSAQQIAKALMWKRKCEEFKSDAWVKANSHPDQNSEESRQLHADAKLETEQADHMYRNTRAFLDEDVTDYRMGMEIFQKDLTRPYFGRSREDILSNVNLYIKYYTEAVARRDKILEEVEKIVNQ